MSEYKTEGVPVICDSKFLVRGTTNYVRSINQPSYIVEPFKDAGNDGMWRTGDGKGTALEDCRAGQ